VPKIYSFYPGPLEVCASEIGLQHNGVFEVGTKEQGLTKRYPLQYCPLEADALYEGSGEIGSSQVRRVKYCSTGVDSLQVCPLQSRTVKSGILNLGPGEIPATQVGIGKIPAREILR
jgi:hypothetical protein